MALDERERRRKDSGEVFPVSDTQIAAHKAAGQSLRGHRKVILAGIGLVALVIVLAVVWYLRQPYFIDF